MPGSADRRRRRTARAERVQTQDVLKELEAAEAKLERIRTLYKERMWATVDKSSDGEEIFLSDLADILDDGWKTA